MLGGAMFRCGLFRPPGLTLQSFRFASTGLDCQREEILLVLDTQMEGGGGGGRGGGLRGLKEKEREREQAGHWMKWGEVSGTSVSRDRLSGVA